MFRRYRARPFPKFSNRKKFQALVSQLGHRTVQNHSLTHRIRLLFEVYGYVEPLKRYF